MTALDAGETIPAHAPVSEIIMPSGSTYAPLIPRLILWNDFKSLTLRYHPQIEGVVRSAMPNECSLRWGCDMQTPIRTCRKGLGGFGRWISGNRRRTEAISSKTRKSLLIHPSRSAVCKHEFCNTQIAAFSGQACTLLSDFWQQRVSV